MPGKWGELEWSSDMARRFPSLAGSPLNTVFSHAYDDAPLTQEKKRYPVLMFEPGLGVSPLEYTALLEDAASHGYVVVGITPTYYTKYSVLSGGRVALPLSTGARPRLSPTKTAEFDQAIQEDGKTVYTDMDPQKAQAMLDKFKSDLQSAFSVWVDDMNFSLNQVEKLNADAGSPFAGRLDLAHVGAFGHSFGGATALQAAKDNPRITAAVCLDCTPMGDAVTQGLPKPTLNVRHHAPGEPALSADEQGKWDTLMQSGKPGYEITINGTLHGSFSDNVSVMTGLGRKPSEREKAELLPPARALAITSAYMDAFFGQYLKDETLPLLSGSSPDYPEVTFKSNR